jgi:hypothetical protein
MPRNKYLGTIHEANGGSPFVVVDSGPGWERRGRRAGDRVIVETWTRTDSVDLSPEAVSALHTLAEIRTGGKR